MSRRSAARSFFAPSLRRTLIARSLVIGIVPMLVIGSLAFAVSQQLLEARFNDEARVVASATANSIADRITLASRGSAVLSALPEVRDLTIARDARGLRELLIPLKSRLALDLAFISDAQGTIIAGAQDVAPGDKLPPELVVRAQARAEASYVIYAEAKGLMIRAISPISTSAGIAGFVETGSLLDNNFLKTLRASSDSEIAILADGAVRVSTMPGLDAATLPKPSETDLLLGPYRSEATIGGQRYATIFTLMQSHSKNTQELAVFLPLAPLEDAQRQIALAVVLGGLILGTLAVAFAYRTARSMTQPLARLATAAERIEQGDLTTPVATGSPHEIGQLERSFGSMAGALWSRDRRNETLVTELRAANVKLEEASRLKSEFIANVSHELRTPMNAILGYTDFMIEGLNGPLNEMQTKDLEHVRTAARDLLGIINGLIDIAKIEAGQMDLNPEPVNLAAAARDTIRVLGDRARARHLVLRSDIDPDMGPGWADARHVRQVLANLVDNAVKFTTKGEVAISATIDDQFVEVVVSDTGEGIKPEAQAFIFDTFRQVDGSSVRRHGGTGLGLAIARRLVWMNGGKMWVESEPGLGSRFHFTLPAAPRTSSAARSSASAATNAHASRG